MGLFFNIKKYIDSLLKGTDSKETKRDNFKIGDYVKFASYNKEPILWRIINKDKDGNLLLYSEKVLCFKAFDCAGNKYEDKERISFGSNEWESSTIRQWLNSKEATISWKKNIPEKKNVLDGINPYDKEAGFLSDENFTLDEVNLIKKAKNKILLNKLDEDKKDGGDQEHIWHWNIGEAVGNYNKSYYRNIEDKVFFLSIKEVKEYVYDRNYEIKSKPTKMAADSLKGKVEGLSEEDYCVNWLRTPLTMPVLFPSYTSNGSNVRCIKNEDVVNYKAYTSHIGVRPALYIDREKISTINGNGKKSNPYRFVEGINEVEAEIEEDEEKKIRVEVKKDQIIMAEDKLEMIPLKALEVGFGGNLEWDSKSKIAKYSLPNLDMEFKVNHPTALVNKKEIKLTSIPKLQKKNIMIPVDFIENEFLYSLEYREGFIIFEKNKEDMEEKAREILNIEDEEQYISDKETIRLIEADEENKLLHVSIEEFGKEAQEKSIKIINKEIDIDGRKITYILEDDILVEISEFGFIRNREDVFYRTCKNSKSFKSNPYLRYDDNLMHKYDFTEFYNGIIRDGEIEYNIRPTSFKHSGDNLFTVEIETEDKELGEIKIEIRIEILDDRYDVVDHKYLN